MDGRDSKDQLGLAINKTGIVAIGRKFYPVKDLEDDIDKANGPFVEEDNKKRYFPVKGKRVYLAVCNDMYGISQESLNNAINCDFIIGLIHHFAGRESSSDFARKGMAGAAKQWGVHVYATAPFFDNKDPNTATPWPSGVKWPYSQSISVKAKGMTYNNIRIKESESYNIVDTKLGDVYLRHYNE